MKTMLRVVSLMALCAVSLLLWILIFWGPRAGGPVRSATSRCLTGDVNGDSSVDISDPIYLLQFMFQGGPPPAACAQDPTLDALNSALGEIVGLLRSAAVSRDCPTTEQAPGIKIYMKLGDIKGDAMERNHKDWIECMDMKASVMRTIPEGAAGVTRTGGATILDDAIITKSPDQASVRIAEASATGKYFDEVVIDLCTTVGEKVVPYLEYRFKDVIVTQYVPCISAEKVALGYTGVDWNYTILDASGNSKGTVTGKYRPGGGGR